MKKPVVVIGMGEMGDLFARGFLKLGYPVVPWLRGMDLNLAAETVPEPELVLVAVGEDDLHPVLERLPIVWRDRLALLQNELLPRDWERHGIANPTVVVVWFDKKKGRPFVAVLPTRVAGPAADLIVLALNSLDVPGFTIPDATLLFELVRKNLYILVINIAGMRVGGTVSELWARHRELTKALATEVLEIQEWLACKALPRERLLEGLVEGFKGDPHHICQGRSAPRRLQRALTLADNAGIAVPLLHDIAHEWSKLAEPFKSA